MSNSKIMTTRYSDEDLMIFKNLIDTKLEKAETDLKFMLNQIQEINEAKDSEGDWMDDTTTSNDLQMLYTMVNRHQKHIQDLNKALLRIQNKSYGICIITNELIDKRRLMAVLTTTKSLAAKTNIALTASTDKMSRPSAAIRKPGERKIISKIISPIPSKSLTSNFEKDIEEEEDLDNGFDDNDFDMIVQANEIELESED